MAAITRPHREPTGCGARRRKCPRKVVFETWNQGAVGQLPSQGYDMVVRRGAPKRALDLAEQKRFRLPRALGNHTGSAQLSFLKVGMCKWMKTSDAKQFPLGEWLAAPLARR